MTYCGRKGCENPAIDRRSGNFGYICPACVRELHEKLVREPFSSIADFMTSPKMKSRLYDSVQEIIDIEFPVDLDN
ncbi:MAG TPA: hypothetical protein VMW10_12260 [Alphaproteobacteria bacterium]|nr:hypothetical protein [Alphaproteobacteria bacterium]